MDVTGYASDTAHRSKMTKITQRASFYSHVNPIWRQRTPVSLSP